MAVTTYYTAAPINPMVGPEQFRADVQQSGAKVILTNMNNYEKLRLSDEWVRNGNIQICIVKWNGQGDIHLANIAGQVLESTSPRPSPNKAEDVALILFTSGTSGTKKVVPITLHSIIAGVVSVMDSWGLSAADTCLNMMPLYHV
jgi:long-subunit acyl-CoA synthetase (AMP-forming)